MTHHLISMQAGFIKRHYCSRWSHVISYERGAPLTAALESESSPESSTERGGVGTSRPAAFSRACRMPSSSCRTAPHGQI